MTELLSADGDSDEKARAQAHYVLMLSDRLKNSVPPELAERVARLDEVSRALSLGDTSPIEAPRLAAAPAPAKPAPVVVMNASNAPGNSKVWTPEKLAEVKAYREKHGTKKTAEHFNISTSLIRRKLPSEKPKPEPCSVFSHRLK